MSIIKYIVSVSVFLLFCFISLQFYAFVEFIHAADIHNYKYSKVTKNINCFNKIFISDKKHIFNNKDTCFILGKKYEY